MSFDIEKFVAPTRELSQLAISSYEDLAEIQIKNILECNRLGIESLKSAASISSPEEFKSYIADQTTQSKVIAENLVADAKSAGEIGQNYFNEAKKVVEGALSA